MPTALPGLGIDAAKGAREVFDPLIAIAGSLLPGRILVYRTFPGALRFAVSVAGVLVGFAVAVAGLTRPYPAATAPFRGLHRLIALPGLTQRLLLVTAAVIGSIGLLDSTRERVLLATAVGVQAAGDVGQFVVAGLVHIAAFPGFHCLAPANAEDARGKVGFDALIGVGLHLRPVALHVAFGAAYKAFAARLVADADFGLLVAALGMLIARTAERPLGLFVVAPFPGTTAAPAVAFPDAEVLDAGTTPGPGAHAGDPLVDALDAVQLTHLIGVLLAVALLGGIACALGLHYAGFAAAVRPRQAIAVGIVAFQADLRFLVFVNTLADTLPVGVAGVFLPLMRFVARGLAAVGADRIGLPGGQAMRVLFGAQALVGPRHLRRAMGLLAEHGHRIQEQRQHCTHVGRLALFHLGGEVAQGLRRVGQHPADVQRVQGMRQGQHGERFPGQRRGDDFELLLRVGGDQLVDAVA